MKTVMHWMCVSYVVLLVAVLSKIVWLLPVQIMAEDFYKEWFTRSGGNLTFWLMILWFVWGSIIMVSICIYDKNETLFGQWPSKLKVCVMVPFAPLMMLRLKKPYFPMAK